MSVSTIRALEEAARAAADWVAEKEAKRPWYRLRPRSHAEAYRAVATRWTQLDESPAALPTEDHVPSRLQAALAAKGWRFIALPAFREPEWRRLVPALDWARSEWIAVPPEPIAVPARRFARMRAALKWARQQQRCATLPSAQVGTTT